MSLVASKPQTPFQTFTSNCSRLATELSSIKSSADLTPLQLDKLKRISDRISLFQVREYSTLSEAQLGTIENANEQLQTASQALQTRIKNLPNLAFLPVACSTMKNCSEHASAEILRREKRQIIYDLNMEQNTNEILDSFELKPELFTDKAFAFAVMEKLTFNDPDSLIEEIDILPITDKSQALAIGSRLKNPEHRTKWFQQFGNRFSFTETDLENARKNILKNARAYEQSLHCSNGICEGLTMATASSGISTPQEELFRKARYIQAAYNMGFILPQLDPVEVGEKMLNNPTQFSYYLSKAAQILNFPDTNALLAAYKAGDRKLELASFVGKFAQKRVDEYRENKKTLDLSNIEINKHRDKISKNDLLISDTKRDLTKYQGDLALLPADAQQVEALKTIIATLEEDLLDYEEEATTLNEALQNLSQKATALRDKTNEELEKGISSFTGIDFNTLPGDFAGEIPEAILKRLKVREGTAVFQDIPYDSCFQKLQTLKHSQETYCIELTSPAHIRMDANEGHAIFVSFKPAQYFDLNDRDPTTFLPIKRTFSSPDEMLAALQKHCDLTYPGVFGRVAIRKLTQEQERRVPNATATPVPATKPASKPVSGANTSARPKSAPAKRPAVTKRPSVKPSNQPAANRPKLAPASRPSTSIPLRKPKPVTSRPSTARPSTARPSSAIKTAPAAVKKPSVSQTTAIAKKPVASAPLRKPRPVATENRWK